MTENRPELSMRASDADREKYGAVLREAFAEGRLAPDEYEERLDAVFRARTYADLVPLVTDLPTVPGMPTGPGVPMAVAGVDGPVVTPVPGAAPASVVAVFGGAERKGTWTMPAELSATAVFGGVEIDFSAAVFSAPVVELKCVAVMGGVSVRVPYGVQLEVDGAGIFGGFSHQPGPPAAPGAPVVRVSGVAFFGGVDITWVPQAVPQQLPAHQLPPQPPPPLPPQDPPALPSGSEPPQASGG